MDRSTTPRRGRLGVIAALLAALLIATGWTPVAAAEVQTTRVAYTDTTTERGVPARTFYEGAWQRNSSVAWATGGAAFEIAFTGETVALFGRKATTNGTAEIYVDGERIGTADYHGPRSSTTVPIFSHAGLEPGDHVLRVVTVGWINHASAEFTATVPRDERVELGEVIDRLGSAEAQDFTPSSWADFAAALDAVRAVHADAASDDDALRAAAADLEAAAAERVQVSGLREAVARYQTRVPSEHTAESWTAFAAALVTAGDVLADGAASAAAVVDAKNGLQEAAAALVTVDRGQLETIENNRFWHDTAGDPIFSQGGGIFRFGDRYYWYGVEYTGSQLYYDDPSRTYTRAGEVDFVAITAYSSENLVD